MGQSIPASFVTNEGQDNTIVSQANRTLPYCLNSINILPVKYFYPATEPFFFPPILVLRNVLLTPQKNEAAQFVPPFHFFKPSATIYLFVYYILRAV